MLNIITCSATMIFKCTPALDERETRRFLEEANREVKVIKKTVSDETIDSIMMKCPVGHGAMVPMESFVCPTCGLQAGTTNAISEDRDLTKPVGLKPDPKIEKFRKELQKRIIKRKKNYVKSPLEPIYDDIYYDFVEWLDKQ